MPERPYTSFSKIWTFDDFEKSHGKFTELREQGRNSDGHPFKLCIFRGDRETRASLYSRIDTLNEENIRNKHAQLYVGQLEGRERFVVLDDSWEDWCDIPLENPYKCACLGFLYRNPKTRGIEIVYEAAFMVIVKTVKEEDVPFTISYRNMGFRMDCPVLFIEPENLEDSPTIISLHSIEFRASVSKTEDLYFIESNTTLKLYYRNQEMFLSIFAEKALDNLILEYYYWERKVANMYHSSKGGYYLLGSRWYENFLEHLEKKKSYVDSFNIHNILEDLQVEVSEFEHTKVGGDDRYLILRKASITDSKAEKDRYISHLIGIGEQVIYEDRGVGFLWKQAEAFRKEHPIGVYEGELLEVEKKKIIQKYSKEEHLHIVLLDELYSLRDQMSTLSSVESTLNSLRELIFNKLWFC